MAQVSSISKGLHGGRFCTINLPKTHKTKSFCSVWLGSELKNVGFGSLKYERNESDSVNSVKVPSFRVLASVSATKEKSSSVPEILLQPINEISGTVKLPGSKSLSNRILLLAALSEVNLSLIFLWWSVLYIAFCSICVRYFITWVLFWI